MASPRPHSETRELISFIVKLAIIVVAVRSLIASPFNIPSESMQPRLLIGDYLLVAKWPYGYSRYSLPLAFPPVSGRLLGHTPERGDVVVFKAPANISQDWIKRVIGLPGDRVQVTHGTVYLNGQAISKQRIGDLVIPVTANMERATRAGGRSTACFQAQYERYDNTGRLFCHYPQYRETLPGGRSYNVLDLIDGPLDNTPAITVPAGHVFVMGDNRDNSEDSRVPVLQGGVGPLPIDNLVGRALVSVFSTDGSANWLLPWTWVSAARFDRIGQGF